LDGEALVQSLREDRRRDQEKKAQQRERESNWQVLRFLEPRTGSPWIIPPLPPGTFLLNCLTA
jgi:hypothetical protein